MDLLLSFPAPGEKANFTLASGQLALDDSLYTAVLISLFTDRRAGEDDELPASETWRRGWWGDGIAQNGMYKKDQIGSRLWLLMRCKATEATRQRAQDYCTEALAWLLEDKMAKAITVQASWIDQTGGLLGLGIGITLPNGSAENYNFIKHLESSHAL